MAPECDVGRDDPEAATHLEIASIYALTPNGPRYDEAAGVAEASAPENLLVLCPHHHRVIDASPEKYTAGRLAEWRADALARRTAELVAAPTRRHGASLLDEALEVWERERGNSDEEFWHQFFIDRPSVLLALAQSVGVGLKTKCYVGGKDIDNRGGGILDFIVTERGNATLVEIKSPTAPLLGAEYRHDVWPPSRELVGACLQALHYRSNLLHEFYALARDEPEFEAPDPQCVVLMGDLGRLGFSKQQRRSLALFRQAMPSVTVLGYDELFERLRRSGQLLRESIAQ